MLKLNKSLLQLKQPFINFKPVLRIRISFHADPDLGSQKCPYGSGWGSGSKEVNTKEEKLHQKISTKYFKMTLKKSLKLTVIKKYKF